MTSKHTPGPWAVVDPDSGGWCVQSSRMTSDAKNGGFVSATCPGPDGQANARLIAEAPTMLALLREVAKASGFAPEGVAYGPRDEARSILARIDGESND